MTAGCWLTRRGGMRCGQQVRKLAQHALQGLAWHTMCHRPLDCSFTVPYVCTACGRRLLASTAAAACRPTQCKLLIRPAALPFCLPAYLPCLPAFPLCLPTVEHLISAFTTSCAQQRRNLCNAALVVGARLPAGCTRVCSTGCMCIHTVASLAALAVWGPAWLLVVAREHVISQ